ncbi:hypothetical protein HD554DRAFT_2024612 [Boletus coccyginus]|nr:hypothetical protein HD554DRAFT_2024612 [Boletus coccyginus]
MQYSLSDLLLCSLNHTILLESHNAAEASDTTFPIIYYSWYNHHATQAYMQFDKGHDAPTHLQPSYFDKTNQTKTNHTQIVPYIFKEMMGHEKVYDMLVQTMSPIFEWIEREVKTYLPDKYKVFFQMGQILPGNIMSKVRSFTLLVLNINVCTCGYHDLDDLNSLVIPLEGSKGQN